MAQQQYNPDTGQWDDQDNGATPTPQNVTPGAPQQAAQAESGSFNAPSAPATPTGAWNREAFRDQSMSRGQGQTAQDFISSHQDISQGVRLLPGSNDKVILPTGEVIDLSINADAQGHGTGNGWTGVGDYQNGQVVAYPSAGGAGASTSAQSGSSSASSPANDALRAELLGRYRTLSNQALSTDWATDPNIKAQVDPYAATQERARRNYLADLAEKAGPNANLRGEQRVSSEQTAQNIGGFQSQLIQHEIDSRRQEIQNALSGMQGLLTQDEQLELSRELAQLNAATSRYGIDTNAATAANAQGAQNQQFYDTLGFNTADRANYYDLIRSGAI